jgi:hypothetical protein
MSILLPLPSRRTHSRPSLCLRAATAIRIDLPDDPTPFDPPEIAWWRSGAGMILIQPGRSSESNRILFRFDYHWQPLLDPWHAIANVLKEAELEYEMLRPVEPRALVVQPRDASLGLSPGEQRWTGSASRRRYNAADVDQLRTDLRPIVIGSAMHSYGMIDFVAGKALTAEAQARGREVIAAWDELQAADVLALARSGLAFWRRVAISTGFDPPRLQQIGLKPPSRNRRRKSIRGQSPWHRSNGVCHGKGADSALARARFQ